MYTKPIVYILKEVSAVKSQAEQPNDFNNYTEYMSTAKLPESVVRAFTQQRIIPKLLEQGRRSFWGVQQEKNDAKAVGLYMQAAKCGSTEAMCFLGWYFQQENNTELALNYLKEAVKENDKEACTLLANYYLNVTKQKSKAVYWYTRAAKQGHIPAQHALASCLEYGIGVPKKDEKNALYWFWRAAVAGSQEAQARYRHLKEKMDSREEAEHGKGGAAAYERFCRKIDGLTENQARAYCQNLAAMGSTHAQFWLAEYYFKGGSLSGPNQKEAMTWYKEAAAGGDDRAQAKLGDYYRFGMGGVTPDMNQAKSWYERAASKGNERASYILNTYFKE